MIGTAEHCNINDLKNLWQICFGDEREYIDFFFENRFVPSDTVVYELNGKPVAQLFLLEGAFRISGTEYPSYYLYAACTDPSFRRRGIMGELLDYARKLSESRKMDFICLVPAEKHLFDYYSKFSYKPVFTKKQITVLRQEFTEETTTCDSYFNSDDIAFFRSRFLTGGDCFVWNLAALNYAVKENEFSDGSFYVSDYGYALVRPAGGATGHVIEICSPDENRLGIINGIFKEFQYEKLVIDAPADLSLNRSCCEKVHNAMALAVSGRAKKMIDNISGAYFGLPLE